MLGLYLKAGIGLTLVTLAAIGAGAGISHLLPDKLRWFERATLILIGGFGLLSTALFLLGQVFFTASSITLLVSIAAAGGLVVTFRAFSRGARLWPGTTGVPKIPAALIALVLLVSAVCGLAEVTGDWNSDTVGYHLLGPKVWLRDGVIRPVPDDCRTAFPQIPETLFATLWSVGGSRAPSFSSFLTLGLLLAVAASIAIRMGLSGTEAWWVAALVATMPTVYSGAASCFVDALFAAFVLAAVRIGLDANPLREWIALGLFCGFAMGTKYTGLLAVPTLILCLCLLNFQGGNPRLVARLARYAGAAVAAACLIAAPYYLRNWVLLGCPIYPPPLGLAKFCSAKYFSAETLSGFDAYIRHRGAGLGRGIGAFLLLPFNLTYHTANFHGAGGIGLCPLALGPIGMLSSRNKAWAKVLALLMFILVSLWFVTQQESRFLIHVYVLAAVFAVLGWRAVVASQRRVSRYLVATVVVLSCSYGLFMILRTDMGSARAVFSPRYAMLRRQTSIPYLASFEYLNGENSVRKVLILDKSVPPFYSDKDYAKPVGQWGEHTLPGAPDSQQALRRALAHQLDVSDVLDVNSPVSTFQIAPRTPGLTLVFEAENQRVYRVD
jgi:hypothetical protein